MAARDWSKEINALNEFGFNLPATANGVTISNAVTSTGFGRPLGETTPEHVARYIKAGCPRAPSKMPPPYKGEIVPPREPRKFREYKPAPHPRAADIRQPKLWTPKSVGNGPEESKLWRR